MIGYYTESKTDIKNRIFLLSIEIQELQKDLTSLANKHEGTIYKLIGNKLLYNQLKKIEFAAK